jgi:1,4-alpha-glucan branching enzyme
MNKNLYGLMNWPEIEGIVYAECDKPKELLGAHVTSKGLLIQIMRPDAVAS